MTTQAFFALLARLLLALVFVVEGWSKIVNYSGTAQYMEHYGVPGALLPLVVLTELGGGLLVACGLFTRIAAFALSGFCLLAALLFHGVLSDPDELVQFYKDLALAGGFLGIVAFGAGEWSVDAWLGRPQMPNISPASTRELRE